MKSFIVIAVSAVVLVACGKPSGGEDGGTNNNNTDAGTDQCGSFATAHQQFLNAPVSSDTLVIKKTPAHPPLDGGALP